MQAKRAIYLDVNAGAHVHPHVVDALTHLLQDDGTLGSNPSSIHAHGRKAKKYLTEARDRVALSLGTSPDDLIFTSSGTEANQLAIRSVFERAAGAHWITTPVEHECNLKMQDWVRENGGSVSLLPVDSSGAPVVSELKSLVCPETALVTAIWVNNETGVITDVEALAGECQSLGIPLHVDGSQAWGKLPVNLRDLGVTYAAFAAHKIGALSGTGVLYARPGASIAAQMKGKQERGRRGGTENILGITAAGVAASKIDLAAWKDIAEMRDRLEALISEKIPGTLVNGGGESARVASTLSLCFEGVEKDGMVAALDLEGFSVSSGSACASGVVEPSHVLLALGREPGLAAAGLRVSIPPATAWEDLRGFAESLVRVVERFRKTSSATHVSQVSSHARPTVNVR